MNKNEAASRNHQIDGPARHNSSRCGNNHIAAVSKKQSENESKKIVDISKGAYMTSAVAKREEQSQVTGQHFNQRQIDILKNSICRGISDEEFQIFLMACSKTQLDPFMRQIYAVKRKNKRPDGSWGETMTIQTGIDGYRLIAERTDRYAPGPEPTYVYDNNGQLLSATSYIKKQTRDGTWHIVSASAYLDEYCQTYTDKGTGEKKPMGMWATMQRTMLAKCAEAQALRKAFPAEMSGVYTKEEMQQSDTEDLTPKMSLEQAHDLKMILEECEEDYRKWVYEHIKKTYKTEDFSQLPLELFNRMKIAALKNMQENHSKQAQQYVEQSELVATEVQ